MENNGFEPLTLCVQGRCSSQLMTLSLMSDDPKFDEIYLSNFATELRAAYSKAVRETLEDEKVFDPKAYGKAGIAAVKELVMARMKVCGCDGKAE